MTQSQWAHLTYASFQGSNGAGGGWRLGSSTGAKKTDHEIGVRYAITDLETEVPFDDYISANEIAALPRKCTYHIANDKSIFVQAVPAGKDATRRPGNVFSHIVINRSPKTLGHTETPIHWYRSPDLLTPFGSRQVNDSVLSPELSEPRPGTYADTSTAWMMIRHFDEDEIGAIYALQSLLSNPNRLAILIVESTDEAALWISALSSTMSREEAFCAFQFSTYTRARELVRGLPQYPTMVAVPRFDFNSIPAKLRPLVVDPEDPSTWQAPSCNWSRRIDSLLNLIDDEAGIAKRVTADRFLPPKRINILSGAPDKTDQEKISEFLENTELGIEEKLEELDSLLAERPEISLAKGQLNDLLFLHGSGGLTPGCRSVIEQGWEPISNQMKSVFRAAKEYGDILDLLTLVTNGEVDSQSSFNRALDCGKIPLQIDPRRLRTHIIQHLSTSCSDERNRLARFSWRLLSLKDSVFTNFGLSIFCSLIEGLSEFSRTDRLELREVGRAISQIEEIDSSSNKELIVRLRSIFKENPRLSGGNKLGSIELGIFSIQS